MFYNDRANQPKVIDYAHISSHTQARAKEKGWKGDPGMSSCAHAVP